MAKASKDDIWIGILETSKSKTIVIRDSSLPEASVGRMYLYNSEREHIVEYVENIVSSKIRDLTDDEKNGLDPDLEKKYRAERKVFLKARGNAYNLKSESEVAPPAKKPVVEEDDNIDIDDDIDDDVDDDWDDSDDDD